jgi:surfeit locus 1 family protein
MRLRFAPRWYWVLFTAVLLPVFVALGNWQWQRGQQRQAQWQEFARGADAPIEATAQTLARLPRYTHVRVGGRFDAGRQFLLENMSYNGAPGYQVLTVLELAEGSKLLVNRGWLPFSGFREQLPDVRLPAEAGADALVLTGRLATLPVAGLASGRVAPATTGPWPRVASFPTLEQLQGAYGAPLLPAVLLLDADSGPGYLRDWQAPGLAPERHIGYAVQWWAFALLLLALFIGFNLKKTNA